MRTCPQRTRARSAAASGNQPCVMRRLAVLAVAAALAAVAPSSSSAAAPWSWTNSTSLNDASLRGLDPYFLHDDASGYYYAFSSDGAGPGYHFGVWRSADLATWERMPGGAMRED